MTQSLRTLLGQLSPLAALALGLLLGRHGLRAPEAFVDTALLLLVGLAGFSAGLSLPSWRSGLRSGAMLGTLLAASTIASGAIAGAVVALLLGHPRRVGAAIGAASGWYSLAGPLVGARDPGLGLVALLANQARELLHVSLYPLLARRGLGLEAVSLGGATTMDTGLPVVLLYGPREAAAAAVVQGLLITLLLPILLPLLLGG